MKPLTNIGHRVLLANGHPWAGHADVGISAAAEAWREVGREGEVA